MIIVFGTGYLASGIVHYENELNIGFFIDNDVKKIGKQFLGYDVKSPQEVVGAKYEQIIITSEKFETEMREQLLGLGVESNKIVNSWDLKLYSEVDVEVESKKELQIRTKEDYEQLEVDESLVQMENIISQMVIRTPNKRNFILGNCRVCKKKVNLLIDNRYSASPLEVNFRERLVCPFCLLNNRQRKMADLVLKEVPKDGMIYLTEQVTPMYAVLKKRFANVIGSEFLGTDVPGGIINEKGIRHEDITRLSFENEVMDCVVSCDVLEHVADAYKALSEIYRVLKKGGVFYASFPMNFNAECTVQRAKLTANGVEYLCEPVYHGNPVSDGGSLVFYDYGFDFMDLVKNAGFEDAYFVPFYSIPDGNIGVKSLYIFVAKK